MNSIIELRNIENGMNMRANFGGNIQDIKQLMNTFHQASKIKKLAIRIFRVWTKNEKILKKLKN